MKRFILLLQFLTRIPINISLKVDEDDFGKAVVYFPLVGYVIGLVLMTMDYLFLNLLPSIAPLMTVATLIIITGGLHLDGLGDTFDGLYSNRGKERVLEIMKDSRLGTNAALALILLILGKIFIIHSINNYVEVYAILLFMPVYARLNVILACKVAKPARSQGMGNLFIGKVNSKQVIAGVLMSFIPALLMPPILIAGIITSIFSFIYVNHVTKKIDGMTGDTIGSMVELGELLFLLVAAIIINI